MDGEFRSFGVGLGIVSVALIIILAALVETHEGNVKDVARRARSADQAAMATEGPAAKRAIAAVCHAVNRPMEHADRGSLDLMSSTEDPGTYILDGGKIKGEDHYVLLGWAVDATGDRLASGVCLVVDGRVDTHAQVYYGSPRPDVASAYHNEDILLTGYRIEIPGGSLTHGKHLIQVASRSSSGDLRLIPAARLVIVN